MKYLALLMLLVILKPSFGSSGTIVHHNEVKWEDLPLGLAIQETLGSSKDKQNVQLAMFTDVDCAECNRQEAKLLKQLQNVTVYYFLYPLQGHHPSSEISLLEKIFCSPNPSAALKQWFSLQKEDKSLFAAKECDLGDLILHKLKTASLKLPKFDNDSPTIVLKDGRVIHGIADLNVLQQLIRKSESDEQHPGVSK